MKKFKPYKKLARFLGYELIRRHLNKIEKMTTFFSISKYIEALQFYKKHGYELASMHPIIREREVIGEENNMALVEIDAVLVKSSSCWLAAVK